MPSLRPIEPLDDDFLFALFAGSRRQELEAARWTKAEEDQFLYGQYRLQKASYERQFPRAEFRVVVLEQRPIGRYYVDFGSSEIRLIDITLLPEVRGKGIGSSFLRRLIETSIATNRPISLHVEEANRAFHWYLRFAFRPIERHGIYIAMIYDSRTTPWQTSPQG